MFFDPLWFYLKQLFVTLVVEVGLLYILNRSKGLDLVIAGFINLVSHLALHIFFSLIITVVPYGVYIYIAGEAGVWVFEAAMYRVSKIIPKFNIALLISLILNIASIIVGWLINLILF